jgi:hypothetical protein
MFPPLCAGGTVLTQITEMFSDSRNPPTSVETYGEIDFPICKPEYLRFLETNFALMLSHKIFNPPLLLLFCSMMSLVFMVRDKQPN